MNLRLNKIQQAIAALGLDAFLVTDGINRNYLTYFTGSAGMVLITPQKSWLLTDFRYLEQAEEESSGTTVVIHKNILVSLQKIIDRIKIRSIGYESLHVSMNMFKQLKEKISLPLKWRATQGIVEGMRAIKTPAEVALIERGIKICLAALHKVTTRIKEGVRENELAIELEHQIRLLGGEKLAFDLIVASGVRGSLPHGRASQKRIHQGEMITFDLGTVCGGYGSDLTRTYMFGTPTHKQRTIYEIVYAAQQEGMKAVCAGVACSAADFAARDLIARMGYGEAFGHSLGHGVGLGGHEKPLVSSQNHEFLQEGMVVTMEPGIYLPQWGGVRIEDCVLVTRTGCEPLSRAPKTLECL